MNEEIVPEKKNKPAQIIGSVILLLVLGVVAWYVFNNETRFGKEVSSENATTTVNIGGVTVELPPGSTATVEEIKDTNELPVAPSLDRKVTFPASFPEDARVAWLAQMADFKEKIKASPTSYDLWLQIGIRFKMIEDFEGARLAWEYATKISPRTPTAFGNLGFLYGYHLKDAAKAEANFKLALANDPQATYLYQQIFEFYRDVLKDNAKARALAEEGKQKTGDTAYFDNLLRTIP